MKVQYEPVMLGVLALFLGNAFLGIPFFSGFPIDILSGVVNVFLLFYALIRRRLFRLQMLASPSLCYGVGFLFSILVFLNIVPSLQNLFHMRPDKNTRIYTLVFSIVFLIIYALFTYLWKLLIAACLSEKKTIRLRRSENLIQQSPKLWIFRKSWIKRSML